jgi:hypothetical protein
MVVDACNSNHSGGEGRRIVVQNQPKQKCEILSEKQTKSKKDWRCSSNSRIFAKQVTTKRVPEFKPEYCQKKIKVIFFW